MRELPPFEWGTLMEDSQKKIKRPILLLENGAKYEGEWLADTDVREGRGI